MDVSKMQRYVGPVDPTVYPHLTIGLCGFGAFYMAWFFVYEVSSNKYTRKLLKELLLSALSAAFLGVGCVFLLLWVGIYV